MPDNTPEDVPLGRSNADWFYEQLTGHKREAGQAVEPAGESVSPRPIDEPEPDAQPEPEAQPGPTAETVPAPVPAFASGLVSTAPFVLDQDVADEPETESTVPIAAPVAASHHVVAGKNRVPIIPLASRRARIAIGVAAVAVLALTAGAAFAANNAPVQTDQKSVIDDSTDRPLGSPSTTSGSSTSSPASPSGSPSTKKSGSPSPSATATTPAPSASASTTDPSPSPSESTTDPSPTDTTDPSPTDSTDPSPTDSTDPSPTSTDGSSTDGSTDG